MWGVTKINRGVVRKEISPQKVADFNFRTYGNRSIFTCPW